LQKNKMELPALRPSRPVAIPLAADATPRARQRILRKIPLTHTLARSLSHSLAHSLTLSRTHHFSLTVSLTLSLCSLRTLASLMLSAQQVVTSMSTPRWRQECRRAEDRSKLPEAGVQEAGGRRQECRRQECRRQERRRQECRRQEHRSIPGLGLGGKRSDAEPSPFFWKCGNSVGSSGGGGAGSK
jgi:hypothetical protein